MKVSKKLYVYVVKDLHENTWIGAVNDHSDTIKVYGMKDKDLGDLDFESDVYHILGWCIENDLRFLVTVRTIEVEFPD